MSDVKKITNLMKKKYGITKGNKKLPNFKVTDDIYIKSRKLADYIYNNGEWNQKDEIDALGEVYRNDIGIQTNNDVITPLSSAVAEKAYVGFLNVKGLENNWINHTYVVKSSEGKDRAIILDPDKKLNTKEGLSWQFRKDAFDKRLSYQNLSVDLPNTFTVGTVRRTIGYHQLFNDIRQAYDEKYGSMPQDKTPFSKEELNRFLKDYLLRGDAHSSSKYAYQHNPTGNLTAEILESTGWNRENKQNGELSWTKVTTNRGGFRTVSTVTETGIRMAKKMNARLDFVNDYLEDTYNISRQIQYTMENEKTSHAKTYQTKKNINKETQEIMQNSILNNQYAGLELDNEVDLNVFKKLEKEIQKTTTVLPKTENESQAYLRLRKLGQHKAAGVFFPHNNTIAIDYRGDDNSENAMIQSFVHEYGHFLDFNNQDKLPLSSSKEFREVLTKVQDKLIDYQDDLAKSGSKKLDYYQTPTEIFARGFEVYSSDKGLNNSLIKGKEVYNSESQYKVYTPEIKEIMNAYFDKQFPNYAERIKDYMQEKNSDSKNMELKDKVKKLNQRPYSLENAQKKGESELIKIGDVTNSQPEVKKNKYKEKALAKREKYREKAEKKKENTPKALREKFMQESSEKIFSMLKEAGKSADNLKDLITRMGNIQSYKGKSYSGRNQLLILSQFPSASKIMTFAQANEAGFKIKRGSHGVKVLLPYEYKVIERTYIGKTRDTGKEYTKKYNVALSKANDKEKKAIEAGSLEVRTKTGYKPMTVFDLEQLKPNEDNGKKLLKDAQKEVKQYQKDMESSPEEKNEVFKYLVASKGVKIVEREFDKGMAIYNPTNKVLFINKDLDINKQNEIISKALKKMGINDLEKRVEKNDKADILGSRLFQNMVGGQIGEKTLEAFNSVDDKTRSLAISKASELNIRFNKYVNQVKEKNKAVDHSITKNIPNLIQGQQGLSR